MIMVHFIWTVLHNGECTERFVIHFILVAFNLKQKAVVHFIWSVLYTVKCTKSFAVLHCFLLAFNLERLQFS